MKKLLFAIAIMFVFMSEQIHAQKVTIDQSIIVGAEDFPQNNIPINGSLLFYDISKAAFRAGSISTSTDFWAPQNIGSYSFAVNRNTIASGSYSTALGNRTVASGSRSIAAGYFSNALGSRSFAFGERLNAEAANSFVIGRYNVGGGNAFSWSSDDPVFEVGIGSNSSNLENAMTIKKDGTVTLKEYSLPNEDGAANQVLATNGNGQTAWASTDKFQNFTDFRFTISNSTWIVPAGITEIMFEYWGAGGGGARGGGGGAGGYMKTILDVIPGEVFTIDLGDGGNGVANGQTADATAGELSTITSSEGLQLLATGAAGATQTNNGNGGTVVANQTLSRLIVIDGESGRVNRSFFYTSSNTLTRKEYGRGGHAPSASFSTGGEGDVEFIANTTMVQLSNEGNDGRRPGGGGGGGDTYKNNGGKAYAIVRW